MINCTAILAITKNETFRAVCLTETGVWLSLEKLWVRSEENTEVIRGTAYRMVMRPFLPWQGPTVRSPPPFFNPLVSYGPASGGRALGSHWFPLSNAPVLKINAKWRYLCLHYCCLLSGSMQIEPPAWLGWQYASLESHQTCYSHV